MKTILKYTRRYRKYPSAAVLVGLLLTAGACPTEEQLPEPTKEYPVVFTVSMSQTAPGTRTVTGPDENSRCLVKE